MLDELQIRGGREKGGNREEQLRLDLLLSLLSS